MEKRADEAEVTAMDEKPIQNTGQGIATEHTVASGAATEHRSTVFGSSHNCVVFQFVLQPPSHY